MNRVLIVEDDEEMCGELCDILMAAKYSVTCVHDGDKGLSSIKKDRFDLVLLDLKMPGISGRTLLKMIKEIRPAMKVLVLTGSPIAETGYARNGFIPYEDIDDALLKLADGVITKPYDIDVVLGRIEEICKPVQI